jgi:hypothetical protein
MRNYSFTRSRRLTGLGRQRTMPGVRRAHWVQVFPVTTCASGFFYGRYIGALTQQRKRHEQKIA